ncbi:transmembrane protein 179B [Latimeria chalumnae]|uniref:Transmembrane protein 179B n=1 Tax=Latimeria chalumnae TaxID=7897 RepID=H3AH09_LATCH|nr:PREDICTED: transmembrane protein 179B [Latimeria chalumnae]|eukprot:XP_005988874.1 PREDICTED: transmembrane protein 179B [Latimeria chalumnae]
MALSWLLWLELLLHGGAFICGIITASSVTVTQGEFGGHCPLYASVQYNATGTAFSVSAFSSVSVCYFVSAISIVIAIYCFSLVLYWIYASCLEEVKRGPVWLIISLVISGIFLFFLLLSSCILQVGKDTLCRSIQHESSLKSCLDAQDSKWTPYTGSRFYSNLSSAQSAAWVNFFFWILVIVLLVLQKKKNSDFAPLMTTDQEWSTAESDPIVGNRARQQ